MIGERYWLVHWLFWGIDIFLLLIKPVHIRKQRKPGDPDMTEGAIDQSITEGGGS